MSENICTKYPIVLVHGIGCRDDVGNAWGRIPEYLRNNGFSVFFGNGNAWTSIKNNAEVLKENILKILEKTGSQKVNIIAHSKGGLDARYMISALDMEDKVSSLTTFNTPHRGTVAMDLMTKLVPRFILKIFAKFVNDKGRKMGDKSPDCFTSSEELSSAFCRKFNEKIKNSPKVYYQSFFSNLQKAYDRKYGFSFGLTKFFSKDKCDGVVNEKSAKWGKYKEILKRFNFNHEDIVDCGKNSRKSNIIPKFYLGVARNLAKMGM